MGFNEGNIVEDTKGLLDGEIVVIAVDTILGFMSGTALAGTERRLDETDVGTLDGDMFGFNVGNVLGDTERIAGTSVGGIDDIALGGIDGCTERILNGTSVSEIEG